MVTVYDFNFGEDLMGFFKEKTFIVDFRLRVASTDFSELLSYFMAGFSSVLCSIILIWHLFKLKSCSGYLA